MHVTRPVFLRVLEYYDGLLFLTTNRVGTLEYVLFPVILSVPIKLYWCSTPDKADMLNSEAFRSRIHLSLYYPALDQQQTMDSEYGAHV